MRTSTDTFKNHLNGQHPLGIYLLDDNEMVRFAAIDIDAYPLADLTKTGWWQMCFTDPASMAGMAIVVSPLFFGMQVGSC